MHDLVTGADGLPRCGWAGHSSDYVDYHDVEWGRPVGDEVPLFEKLCLEGFQSGLSWITILRKRPAFRDAFAGFDIESVARFGAADVTRLLADAGIVRHRGKIEAAIANARAMLDLHHAGRSLAGLVWAFEPDGPRRAPKAFDDVPAVTPESTALARELCRLGFRFVGPTTAYAFMQAMGIVNDHLAGCHARGVCEDERRAFTQPTDGSA